MTVNGKITFDTTPVGNQFTYVAGLTTYSPTDTKYTSINQSITFTATTILPDGVIPVEYRWDFGDGTIDYGNPVTHTYKFVFPECQAVLRVLDSNGDYHLTRKQIYLTDPLADPLAVMANYIPADPSDTGPPSLFELGSLHLQPRINFSVHNEYSYGAVFTPSYALSDDFEIRQQYNPGHNSNGRITHGGDQHWDPTIGCNGRYTDWGAGGKTTLGTPQFLTGTQDINVVSTASRFPAQGVARLVSGNNQMLVHYTAKTSTSLTGVTSVGSWTDADNNPPTGTFDFNWPANTSVVAVIDSVAQTNSWNIKGFFGWWDMENAEFGFYYSDYAASGFGWHDFGGGPDSTNADQTFIDIGRLGWQTELASDWVCDISTYAGSPVDIGSIPVVDSSGFPDSTFMTGGSSDIGFLVYEGDPLTIYNIGSTQNYIQMGSYQKPDSTHLEGAYHGGGGFGTNRLDGGSTHTFPAGTKVVIPSWFGTPLTDGSIIPYTSVRAFEGSSVNFDNSISPIAGASPFHAANDSHFILPDTNVWTILRCVGNNLTWELWKEDPDTLGSTYMIRMRTVLSSVAAIAAFGSGASGTGFGPGGWWSPPPTGNITWNYTEL